MAVAGTPKDDTGLERKMESRHLTMVSLGGVIGTGLFVSSGYTIHQAGPLGAILAYAAGSLLVYCVMVRWASCPWPCRMPAASTCMRSGSSARHRVHHCYPVLAELGGGARIGVHGGRAADAAMVPAFAVLGVVGRVHCGGVRAWYGRWPRSG